MRLKQEVELHQCYLEDPQELVPNAAMRALLFLDYEPRAPPDEKEVLTSVPLKELELPGTATDILVCIS
jgi:hypothetical protein